MNALMMRCSSKVASAAFFCILRLARREACLIGALYVIIFSRTPMKCVLKIFLLALVFAGFAFAEAQDGDEPSVSKFRERFSLRFLCDYNFVAIWNSAYNNSMLNSNRPVDVGIGFGYDLSLIHI